ncbi:MAG: tRNA 2-thiouridine(34) synthase MnmA [Lachnospiraceae bacterium]|nr:tRNA 2-thiouridine(34) synthase MnmA [Lachnospiraceae bacterium]
MESKKAIIAMSGGVDSSVAAFLMKDKGYNCIGATMKLYDNDDINIEKDKTCCSLSDIDDARNVAYSLGMEYYVFNFTDNFEKEVIDRFINTYMCGGTPNPCIDCNRYIKFEKLMNRMYELGYDYVVTGHYARIEKDENTGRYLLKKGLDESKDQSYVLYNMTQEQLSHTLFPLGEFTKTRIREIAEEKGFVNARKKDSQDICFVPDGDYASFIEKHCNMTFPEGDFVDKEGNVLGKHKGIIRYTVGQRKGLGLSLKSPMYVYDKDIENNRVILSDNESLFKTSLIADNMNWIEVEDITEPIRCKAKIRYKQKEADCVVTAEQDGKVKVTFDEPVRGITKGQAVVLYDGDIVVGGGTIIG